MENYLFVNKRKIPLSEEQVKGLSSSVLQLTPEQTKETGLVGTCSAIDLSRRIQNGEGREILKPHDIVNFDGIVAEVIGFNHDEAADDADRPTVSFMARQIIEKRPIHDGDCPRGWIDTDLRAWLNGEFFSALPVELKTAIVPVKRLTRNGEGEAFETVDKLFVLTESEMFGSAIYSNHEEGERYEAFDTSENRVRQDDDGDNCPFWCCSSFAGNSGLFCCVNDYGYPNGHSAADAWVGAPLCFCL